MFAVIKTGGKQYRVIAEDLLQVERIAGEPGEIIQFADVLAVGEGEKVTFGTPLVAGASVAAEVVEQGKGPKVIAFKKRRRQNSRRKRGHRQLLTTVRISEILLDGAKPSKKAAAKPKADKDDKAAQAKTEKKEPAKAEKKPAKAEAKPAKETKAEKEPAPKKAEADDLTKIKGIGKVAAGKLGEQNVTTYAALAALSDEDVERIAGAASLSADQLKEWREQAKALAQ